jgi:hypothetical protein
MLTEVHRQAQDNPIISLSMKIREGGRLRLGTYGNSRVIEREDIDAEAVLATDQVLVGLNKTRRAFNDRIRQLKGMDPAGPQAGDRLVCLRNNKEKNLLNGGLWDVESVEKSGRKYIMLAKSDDHIEERPTEIEVRREFFEGKEDTLTWDVRRESDEFTYGYALTCHKRTNGIPFNVFLEPENDLERENLKAVIAHMDELMRVPTIVRRRHARCLPVRLIRPAPSRSAARSRARMRSIPASTRRTSAARAITVFKRDDDPKRLLDAVQAVTHFGPGGRN